MDTQEAVLPIDEAAPASIATSCPISETKVDSSACKPTQEEIDAEALVIAKRLMQRHAKTWTELAKY